MILGFGQTEIDFENKLENDIKNYVIEEFKKIDISYFSTNFFNQVKKYVFDIKNELSDKYDEYKKSTDFPERYSIIYPTVIEGASHIVFIIKFTHVNRRHAFSADGWSSFSTEKVFYIYSGDIEND